MSAITDPNPPLQALGDQLAAIGQPFELVVIGGSGLLALGIIARPTQDVDLVALRVGDTLRSVEPFPRTRSLPPATE